MSGANPAVSGHPEVVKEPTAYYVTKNEKIRATNKAREAAQKDARNGQYDPKHRSKAHTEVNKDIMTPQQLTRYKTVSPLSNTSNSGTPDDGFKTGTAFKRASTSSSAQTSTSGNSSAYTDGASDWFANNIRTPVNKGPFNYEVSLYISQPG